MLRGRMKRKRSGRPGKWLNWLGIPYMFFDCSACIRNGCCDYFRSEYLSGRTPNPCVKCNQYIKFGLLPGKIAATKGVEFDYLQQVIMPVLHGILREKDTCWKKQSISEGSDLFYLPSFTGATEKCDVPLGSLTKKRGSVKLQGELISLFLKRRKARNFYSGDYKDCWCSGPAAILSPVTEKCWGNTRA